MNPGDVPHALRLQAILTSGVVIIYDRKTTFLLEDCSDALKRLNVESSGPTFDHADLNLDNTKVPDITLHDEIAFLDSSSLFPTFNNTNIPQKRKQSQLSDDLFIMPSVPESTDGHARQRKTHNETSSFFTLDNSNTLRGDDGAFMNQHHNNREDYFLMDGIMDVPDLPPDAFDMPPIPMDDDGGLHMLMDYQLNAHDEYAHHYHQDVNGGDNNNNNDGDGQAEMAPFTPAHQKGKRGKKGKRVVIDDLHAIVLSSTEQFIHGSQPVSMHFSASQRSMDPSQDHENNNNNGGNNGNTIMHERRRRGWMNQQAASIMRKKASKSTSTMTHDSIQCNPATGPWSKELMAIWQQCIDTSIAHGMTTTDTATINRRDGGDNNNSFVDDDGQLQKKARNFPFDDMYQEYNNAAYQPDGDYGYGIDDPAINQQMDDIPYDQQPSFYENPFAEIEAQRVGRRTSTGTANSDGMIEAERLRAALHGTPGNDYRSAMFQLGLTPASEEGDYVSGQKRISNKYRRDSTRSGRLSERSSSIDRGMDRGGRLADLLEDLQAPDIDTVLPVLRNEYDNDTAVPSDQRMSQFNLLEESIPSSSVYTGGSAMEMHTMHTLEVLASARTLTDGQDLSLFYATSGLTRLEAAQFFFHVLVGTTKKYIEVEQEDAYGDVTIHFAK